jgi:dimethylamine monooxygenase subunit A
MAKAAMQNHPVQLPDKGKLPPGVYLDRITKNCDLATTLRADDMERFSAVPKTVMINPWQEDLEWLIVDRSYPGQIARRLELLCLHPDMALARLPGAEVDAAEIELRDTVADYLTQTYPHYFQRAGNFFLSPLTGLAIDLGAGGADPLIAIALMSSEDMLILMPEARAAVPEKNQTNSNEICYVLKSGALLFPNDWSLTSHFDVARPDDQAALPAWEAAHAKSQKAARLGKSPHDIHHGHVAHYSEHFSARVDLFFTGMQPGLRSWRRNWGMRMSDELFLHSDCLPAGLPTPSAEHWENHGYLRSEHETFCKLPGSGAVVFTIKTYLWKLSELVQNPVALQALRVADDNLAPGMLAYRADNMPSFRDFLKRHGAAKLSG